MHCIRESFPPSKRVLRVIIVDPIQIIMKTVEKTIPESFFDVIDKILTNLRKTYNPNSKHIRKGPQRSQYFNSLTLSSLT
jgi:hypothetical protein